MDYLPPGCLPRFLIYLSANFSTVIFYSSDDSLYDLLRLETWFINIIRKKELTNR